MMVSGAGEPVKYRCDLYRRDQPALDSIFTELGPIVDVKIEFSRWSFVKRNGQGKIDYVSPLPCPFAYAEILHTRSGDGEAIDAMILGAAPPPGHIAAMRVIGLVDVIDGGVSDPKILVRAASAQEAPLDRWERQRLVAFLALWLPLKRALALFRGEAGQIHSRGIFAVRGGSGS